ncbi:MAG: histidine phosphatase family protein [Candidatus ainarchaeum sp.]|nr:histidine phosphatase family protein [Candidatus ainarchaeum sp.]
MNITFITPAKTMADEVIKFKLNKHLSDEGKNETIKASKNLIDKIDSTQNFFVSTDFDAVETAQLILSNKNKKLIIIDELRKRDNLGYLKKLNYDEIMTEHVEEIEELENINFTVKGGESYFDFAARLLAAMDKIIIENLDEEQIMIIANQAIIDCFFRERLAFDLEQADPLTMFELSTEDGETFEIVSFNQYL